MYYMWINKNLVHQVGDQTKVPFMNYDFALKFGPMYLGFSTFTSKPSSSLDWYVLWLI